GSTRTQNPGGSGSTRTQNPGGSGSTRTEDLTPTVVMTPPSQKRRRRSPRTPTVSEILPPAVTQTPERRALVDMTNTQASQAHLPSTPGVIQTQERRATMDMSDWLDWQALLPATPEIA